MLNSDSSKILVIIVCTLILGFTIQSMFSIMVITGDSMYPELEHQDIVILKDNPSSVTEQDIVAVPSGRGFAMVHKTIEVSEETIQTKGTNNSYKDSPTNKENIKGKVIYSISPPKFIKNSILEILYPTTYKELENNPDIKQY